MLFYKKDYLYRVLFFKYEFFKLVVRFLIKNIYIDSFFRKYLLFLILSLSKKGSICLIKNRCLISGGTRSVHRFFRISRWELKKLGLKGELLGLSKGSW